MGCVKLRCSMLKYIGELGYQGLKKQKSKYSILNIDSVREWANRALHRGSTFKYRILDINRYILNYFLSMV